MRRILQVATTLFALTLATAACGEDQAATEGGLAGTLPEVHVYDAWVELEDASTAAVSLRVHNAGPEDDRLLAVACACDATVEIDGALVARPDEEIVIRPAGVPGIRLTDLAEAPRRGDFVTLTLTFEHAGEVTADAEVRRPAASPTP
jgi:copper(I)-binding protein